MIRKSLNSDGEQTGRQEDRPDKDLTFIGISERPTLQANFWPTMYALMAYVVNF